MRSLFVVATLLAVQTIALSATIHVPQDQPTIQAGISQAVNGDTVLVAPGTYLENINFLGKAITVMSSDGADATIINGGSSGSVVLFYQGEGLDSVLDGFGITNGTGTYVSGHYCGGGICCVNDSSPTLKNNVIYENIIKHDGHGGGIHCTLSSPLITNNIIKGNKVNNAYGIGAGIYCMAAPATITYNTITENYAGRGAGGIFFQSYPPTITNNIISYNISKDHGGGISGNSQSCTISNNLIMGNTAELEYGGGIDFVGMLYTEVFIFTNNIVVDNSSGQRGGGIFLDNTLPFIQKNIISDNTAVRGGGLYIASYKSVQTISDNIITGNSAGTQGGGIDCYKSAMKLANNTIAGNTVASGSGGKGGGILCSSGCNLTMANTILWGNDALVGPEVWIGNTTTLTVDFSDLEGGQPSVYVQTGATLNWGSNMIDADPLFVDSASNDFHLTFTSPCKDTGDNTAVVGSCDMEGDPRVAYHIVDMGADEFYTHLYYTGNPTPGGFLKLKFIDTPSTSPVILYLGSGIMDPPVHLKKYGDWYLQLPLLLEAVLGSIPGPDGVLALPFLIPVDLPTPLHLPLQGLVGSRLTNLCELTIE